jgi:DNA-binding transcriptional MerR regulator
MSAESVFGADELITLEELSERMRVSVRNIRFYTTRGLLPPPIRRGRSGYYSRDHVSRLELVKQLQAHGFTLSAIERYVARIHDGATPEEIALHRVTLQPFLVEQPVLVTRGELNRRAGRKVKDRELEALLALGVLTVDSGRRYRLLESQLASALRLVELDVPVPMILAGQQVYHRHAKAMADEFGELFRSTFWPAYKEGRISTEQMVALMENFHQGSVASLAASFSEAMTEARRAEVARRARP